MKKESLAFTLILLVYSVTGLAYLHKTFVSKDLMMELSKQLDKIERKVDHIRRCKE
jgi:hypothetical protein